MIDHPLTKTESDIESLNELFVQICVSMNSEFVVSAWDRWQAQTSIETADLAFHRLMPLLYRNLERAGVAHPSLAKLRGTIRHAWARNQRLLEAVRPVLNAIVDESVPVVLLGDTALSHSIYRDPGLRPMTSFDFAVPLDSVEFVMDCLVRDGWRLGTLGAKVDSHDYRIWVPSCTFQNQEGQLIRLYWHVVPLVLSSVLDRELSEKATLIASGDRQVKLLDSSGQFWTLCVMGSGPPVAALVDLVDAANLLSIGDKIDWQWILDLSIQHRVSQHVAYSMTQLVNLFDVALPPDLITALREVPVLGYERDAFRIGIIPPSRRTLRQKLRFRNARYRRTLGDTGMASGPRTAIAFLQHSYNLQSALDLPAFLTVHGARHLVRLLS